MSVTVKIELLDNRDGCTYERIYVDTPDFSDSVRDLITLTMGDCWPDFTTARIGDGFASGRIVNANGRVGSFLVTDDPNEGTNL